MGIHLCWNTGIKSKCYNKCIVKRVKTFRKYEFISSIPRGGTFNGACVCCYGSVCTPKRKKAERCIYVKGQGSTSLILLNGYVSF